MWEKEMKWTRNKELAKLVIAENAEVLQTTYERLCYHLVNEHGEPEWVVVQRHQVELEDLHTTGRTEIRSLRPNANTTMFSPFGFVATNQHNRTPFIDKEAQHAVDRSLSSAWF
jgi:hypothetical protein